MMTLTTDHAVSLMIAGRGRARRALLVQAAGLACLLFGVAGYSPGAGQPGGGHAGRRIRLEQAAAPEPACWCRSPVRASVSLAGSNRPDYAACLGL